MGLQATVVLLIQKFIFYGSSVAVLAACLVGVARYRRLELTRRYLVWLSLLALVMTVITTVLAYNHRPNLFLSPIDTAIEFTLLALMYRRVLWPLAVARYLPVVIGLFLLGSALTYQPRLTTAEFSPVQHFIESLVILGLVLVYFHRILRPPITLAPLEYEPMFWVSAGLLLYFAANSLIFLTSNYILLHFRELSRMLWTIHALLYTFLNIFYVIALSITPRPGPKQWSRPSGITQS